MEKSGLHRGKILVAMIACSLISLTAFYKFLSEEKVAEKDGLILLSGKLEDYLFQHYDLHRSPNRKYYVLKLANSQDIYQIGLNEVWLFKKDNFIDEVAIGEDISIEIPIEQKLFKLQNGNIPLYGITKADKIYLNSQEVLREKAAPISLLISIITILAALVLFLLYKKTVKTTTAISELG